MDDTKSGPEFSCNLIIVASTMIRTKINVVENMVVAENTVFANYLSTMRVWVSMVPHPVKEFL